MGARRSGRWRGRRCWRSQRRSARSLRTSLGMSATSRTRAGGVRPKPAEGGPGGGSAPPSRADDRTEEAAPTPSTGKKSGAWLPREDSQLERTRDGASEGSLRGRQARPPHHLRSTDARRPAPWGAAEGGPPGVPPRPPAAAPWSAGASSQREGRPGGALHRGGLTAGPRGTYGSTRPRRPCPSSHGTRAVARHRIPSIPSRSCR